jgi:acyl-coenzyme A thioesterase PaaI-like protein
MTEDKWMDSAPQSEVSEKVKKEIDDRALDHTIRFEGAVGRLRLADAIRTVLQHAATSTAPDEIVAGAANLVEEAVQLLEPGPHGRGYHGSAEGSFGGVAHGFSSHSPVTGRLNALAPAMTLTWNDTDVLSEVVYGDAYEGPPGHVHGGFIAAIFDEVLGFAQALTGAPGFTARLEITYRSPTPLHTPLKVSGRFERIDGRKIYTSGAIHAGDRLCAEAKGLFVSARPDHFQQLDQARRENQARSSD